MLIAAPNRLSFNRILVNGTDDTIAAMRHSNKIALLPRGV
jgi:hypothetical protein